MSADAALVALGCLFIALVGCAALVWLARRAQTLGTEFRGVMQTRMFTFHIESRPSSGDDRPDAPQSPGDASKASAQHSSAADQS
jgi:hypothetical protein